MGMAQNDTNEDFKDFMFKGVELQFPRLKDTYRFNNATGKSELCAQNVANAAWSCGMKMPKAVAKEFYKQMKAHYEARQKLNDKLQPFSQVFGMKKNDEEGTVTFEAKKKGVTDSGKVNKPPTVIDSQKQPITGDRLEFWSGTTANVRVRAFPTTSPKNKENPNGLGGISLLLDVIQVLKPKYGSANLDGFDVEDVPDDDGAAAAADAFEGAAQRKSTTAPGDEF